MQDPTDEFTKDWVGSQPHPIAENVEDAKGRAVLDSDKALSDEQLIEGGLAPVRAFVRTKTGKSALRAQRHKEKAASVGVKQINVMAPESVQPTIREIAKRTKNGEDLVEVMTSLLPDREEQAPPTTQTTPEPPKQTNPEDDRVLAVIHAGGWRGRLIRMIAR